MPEICRAALVQCELACQLLLDGSGFFDVQRVQDAASRADQRMRQPSGKNCRQRDEQQHDVGSGTECEQPAKATHFFRQKRVLQDKSGGREGDGYRLEGGKLREQCERAM